MHDDADTGEPRPEPIRHAGVIIPSPAERETLSPERRAAIMAHNRAVRDSRDEPDRRA